MADEPFWQVLAVFDPDGGGADFAYTVGLAERGLPELHIWARPTDGLDPGEDWALSDRDRCGLLNEFAYELLGGRLHVGQRIEKEFDGGMVRVTFRVGDPVEPEVVDAFQVAPDTVVWPIRWALHREPAGELAPVDESVAAAVRAEVGRAVTALDPVAVRALPARWEPAAGDIDLTPTQRFGPLTALVVARGAAVATADADTLAGFCHASMLAEQAHGVRHALALVFTAARRAGRREAVEQARRAAEELTDIVTGTAGTTRRWREVVAEIGGGTGNRTERAHFARALRNLLCDATATLLGTTSIIDVADEATLRAGLGAWTWGRSGGLVVPDPLWWAPKDVLHRVRGLIGDLDAEQLRALGEAHELAIASDPRAACVPGYAKQHGWLHGIAIVEPVAMPPPHSWLLGVPAGASLLSMAADPGAVRPVFSAILEALSTITIALAVADKVRSDDWRVVLAPYEPLVPGLTAAVSARAAA